MTHFDTFEELTNYVLGLSNAKEQARIQEELALFKERNWEDYILFVVNFLSDANERTPFVYHGSVYDSYLVRKVLFDNTNPSFLTNEKARDILFHDSLKIDISVIWLGKRLMHESLVALEISLQNSLGPLGLYRREIFTSIDETRGIGSELLIVSRQPITDHDMDVILNEKKESSPEEAEVLRNHVAIRIRDAYGI